MSGIPNWDKISSPQGSTTKEFGGNWANLISDYYNGVNITLLDANKSPLIGTVTRYKYEKLSLLDVDSSHSMIFSVDDIDTGPTRKVKFRRMNTPYEEDYAVLEQLTQTLINKTINADSNTITNIENADIKAAAGILTTKLADSTNFILKTLDNSFGAHYQDFTKITAPTNPGVNDIRLYVDTADTHMKIRNNSGTVVDLHTVGGGGGVTASSTDTFTNKSISLSTNTVTDASRATGDIPKDNGTKYVRLGRGSANQFLKVNTGGTDVGYEALDVTLDSTAITTTNTKTLTNKTVNPTNNTILFSNSFEYTLYQDGGAVKARNNVTGAITSNANLNPLIVTILASSNPSFEVMPGTYNLASFSGWSVTQNYTHAYLHPGTIIAVPNAYTGNVWTLAPTSGHLEHVRLEGGYYKEQGSAAYDWDLLEIAPVGTDVAVLDCIFSNMHSEKCYAPIHIITNGLSWANGNRFSDFFSDSSIYLILFDHVGTYTPGDSGPNGNVFTNVGMQAATPGGGNNVLGGVIGVLGQFNTFINCACWDVGVVAPTVPSMTISANADSTLILGGALTHNVFSDSGVATMILDKSQGNQITSRNILNITKKAQAGVDETLLYCTIDDAPTDFFSITNSSATDAMFAPLIRANTTSTAINQFYAGLFFQTIIRNDLDVVPSTACNIISGQKANNTTLSVRPILEIDNRFTPLYVFYPTYADFTGKQLVNVSGIAQNPLNKRWGTVQPGHGTAVATVGVMDGLCQQFTATGAGSNTTSFDTTEGKVINYQTSSASGVAAGLLSNTAGGGLGRRLFAGKMVCRFKLDSTTSARFYFGLTSATTLPIGEAPLGNTDNGIIVGFNAADTNYQVRTNDGATSVTTTQMGGSAVAKTNATGFHTIEISWTASGDYTVSYDGTAQTYSTDLPATTADLYPNLMVQTSAVVQRTLTLKGLYIETDK